MSAQAMSGSSEGFRGLIARSATFQSFYPRSVRSKRSAQKVIKVIRVPHLL